MSIELSRRVGKLLGAMDDPPDFGYRMRLARAVSRAKAFEDLPKEFQNYIKTAESANR